MVVLELKECPSKNILADSVGVMTLSLLLPFSCAAILIQKLLVLPLLVLKLFWECLLNLKKNVYVFLTIKLDYLSEIMPLLFMLVASESLTEVHFLN